MIKTDNARKTDLSKTELIDENQWLKWNKLLMQQWLSIWKYLSISNVLS